MLFFSSRNYYTKKLATQGRTGSKILTGEMNQMRARKKIKGFIYLPQSRFLYLFLNDLQILRSIIIIIFFPFLKNIWIDVSSLFGSILNSDVWCDPKFFEVDIYSISIVAKNLPRRSPPPLHPYLVTRPYWQVKGEKACWELFLILKGNVSKE